MKFSITITKKLDYCLECCEFCGSAIPIDYSSFTIDTFAGDMTICYDCLNRIAEIINCNQIKNKE